MVSQGETSAKPDNPLEVKLGAHWANLGTNQKANNKKMKRLKSPAPNTSNNYEHLRKEERYLGDT